MSEVNLILPQNTPKTIKGPLAGDKPIYIYIYHQKMIFCSILKI